MRIFITRPIPAKGIEILKQKGFEVLINESARDRAAALEELMAGAKGSDAILSVLTDRISAEVIAAGRPTLKIIANYAAGFDNIDLETAKTQGVMVTNTPEVLTNSVAEYTFALILGIARRLAEADKFSRAGKFRAWGPELLLGTDVFDKTLGIIGLGRIGSRVASHAVNGFGMKVLYYDPRRNDDFEKEFKATYVSDINKLLPQCDFVSIHVPLLESTHHLINETRLKLMRPTAFLINTSRGQVIDEETLAQALKEGWIKGAAIDVFEFEPEINPQLKELENVIITPHIASATRETRDKMAELAALNIIEALEGRKPPNLLN